MRPRLAGPLQSNKPYLQTRVEPMDPMPRVSVIIPAFNAEPYITETLDSVLAQTYPHFEVIVSDDGSTDATRERVAAYGSRVKYVYRQNSGGVSAPRNAGVRAASGSLLAFIDADDLMAPGRIAAEVRCFARHPDVGLVFSDYAEFGPDKIQPLGHFPTCPRLSRVLAQAPVRADSVVLDSATATELLLTENFGSSSPMVRRRVFDLVGGYDESTMSSEDFDFQYRVAAACPVGIVPGIHWHKRQHPMNMSANVERVLRWKIEVRRRILQKETSARRRRTLKRRIADWHVDLAYFYTGRDNSLAFRHVLDSLRFSVAMRPKVVGRLALKVLGRRSSGTASR
jgi:glycosyltransferase involved in cell wall biosynthesis